MRIGRRALALAAVAAAGVVALPAAAQASTVLSASATGWGTNWTTAEAAANNNAYNALYDLARAQGETCANVTYADSLYYIVPGGGGYVFSATATGTCA